MIGEIRFTYIAGDIVAMRRAVWMGALHWGKPAICFAAVFLFFFLIMFGDELATGGRMFATDAAVSISAAVLMTGFLFGSGYLRLLWGDRKAIRSMDENRLWKDEQHIWWDDKALSGASSHGQFERPWDTLSNWLDAPHSVLIYTSGSLTLVLPKRAFDAGEAGRFIELLAEHLPERKRFGLIAAERKAQD